MPWRSRLIASTRSSRSVVSVVYWVSTSSSSSSARRLTAPSRSRSRRSRSSVASTSATSGSGLSALSSASPATSAGGTSSISTISWSMSDKAPLAGLEALLGAGGVFAGAAHRLERGASVAIGFCQLGLGFGQPVGGSAATAFGRLDLADQRGALLGEHLRRVFQAGAFGLRFLDADRKGFDLRGSARLAGGPALVLGRDGDEPAGGLIGLARQALRFGADLGEVRAVPLDLGPDRGEPLLDLGRRRQGGERLLDFAARHGGFFVVRGQARLRFGERRAA